MVKIIFIKIRYLLITIDTTDFNLPKTDYENNPRINNGIIDIGCYEFIKPNSVENQKRDLPNIYSLAQNFPNPFNPSTSIQYAVVSRQNVKVVVYNSLGQAVKTFNEGEKESGIYTINFNGEGLSSGVYLYSINAVSVDGKQNYRATKKMLLMK